LEKRDILPPAGPTAEKSASQTNVHLQNLMTNGLISTELNKLVNSRSQRKIISNKREKIRTV